MLKIKEFHKDGSKVELKELEKFGFKSKYYEEIEKMIKGEQNV